jgi:radical SAM superfamily enzyme YgiQ (UPF0313 family)
MEEKKVLFIYPLKEAESLGIECLSAYLKKRGHKTDLILHKKREENFKERLKKRIKKFNPDFIGFSVMTEDYAWACKIARLVKKITDKPVIFGGNHPTSCPEDVLKNNFVDYIVRSEGEDALIEIIENPNKINIRNVWMKKKGRIIRNDIRPLIQDLDSLPLPDKNLFNKESPHFKDLYICMVGRGCPFNCTYCFNNYMRRLHKGELWLRKKRSVDNVINELKMAKDKIKPNLIYFIDDIFTSDKEWLKEFLKKYRKEINIPFKSLSHPFFIDDELCAMLNKSKCIEIELGVQTPIEKMRKEICKRPEDNETVKKAVNIIKKNNMMVSISSIFALPSENIKDYKKGSEFYIDIKPHKIACFWLQYYPETEIIDIGKKYGEFTDEELKRTINGEIDYVKNRDRLMENKELLYLSRFYQWIPVLPRSMSRFISRTKLYRKIFFTDRMNIIPRILVHLTSFKFMRVLYLAMKRKKIIKNI